MLRRDSGVPTAAAAAGVAGRRSRLRFVFPVLLAFLLVGAIFMYAPSLTMSVNNKNQDGMVRYLGPLAKSPAAGRGPIGKKLGGVRRQRKTGAGSSPAAPSAPKEGPATEPVPDTSAPAEAKLPEHHHPAFVGEVVAEEPTTGSLAPEVVPEVVPVEPSKMPGEVVQHAASTGVAAAPSTAPGEVVLEEAASGGDAPASGPTSPVGDGAAARQAGEVVLETTDHGSGGVAVQGQGRGQGEAVSPPRLDPASYRAVLNESLEWVAENAPYFECSDDDITQVYWYRWRLFHMHVEDTIDGFVITEFLPKVFWSGPHNTISCPAGHHIMEGRWLSDRRIVDDYSRFWFRRKQDYKEDKKVWEKMYTFWAASSIYKHYLISGNSTFVTDLLPDLDKYYKSYMATHYHEQEGCMFVACHADGEENSAGLDGCRPTINAMMFGEASALAAIATLAGNAGLAAHYTKEAEKWQAVVLTQLWSDSLEFFVTKAAHAPPTLWKMDLSNHLAGVEQELHEGRLVTYFGCLSCAADRTCPPVQGWPQGRQVTVRELMGLSSPWYFNVVPTDVESTTKLVGPGFSAQYAAGFQQLRDERGFDAKYGPTTTERRHDCYNFTTDAQCNWNGGMWPFETSKTGTALINLLQRYPPQPHATKTDFMRLLGTYARAHTQTYVEGSKPPHIDEDLHPDDGFWITRRKLYKNPNDPLKNRGDHYFHSSYNDLVIAGLVGIQAPEELGITDLEDGLLLVVNPLLPVDSPIRWFTLQNLVFRGRTIDVAYDADGTHYGLGSGLMVWMNGKVVARADTLTRLEIYQG